MRLWCAVGMVLVLVPVSEARQDGISPQGGWHGRWTSPDGWDYLAEMELLVRPDGSTEGEITWMLKKAARAPEQAMIGLTAVEHVRGRYDAKRRIVSLEGHKKDDPDNLIGLDKYRLLMAEDGRTIAGPTAAHGTWRGLISFARRAADRKSEDKEPHVRPHGREPEPAVEPRNRHPLSHSWQGRWTAPGGIVQSAEMELAATRANAVEGFIRWTLEESPNEEDKARIGCTGIEFVRGQFDPESRIVTLAGHKKDDPDGVLGEDRYTLILAETGESIAGLTRNHGDWRGLFSAKRRKAK